MADLKISQLSAISAAELQATDPLALADLSASETKKVTIKDLIEGGVLLIDDASIPGAKVDSAVADGSITTAKLANDAVTGAKISDNSIVVVGASLPGSGDYIGQLGLETTGNTLSVWSGSAWVSAKAAGSINAVAGSAAGLVPVSVSTSSGTATVSASLAASTGAAEFLAGPTGAAGAVSLRAIASGDLPTATTSAKGAVSVNGQGLTLSGDQIVIDNTVTASATGHLVTYDAQGLITGGAAIASGDLPIATSVDVGGVRPGTGLSMGTGGAVDHTNVVTPATATKISYDAEGHITGASSLLAADIPDLPASKITSGTLNISLFGTKSITGAKLADSSTVQFGGAGSTSGVVTFPVAEFKGQYFWDELNGDLYIWSGSAWLPVTITSGELIYAGTYDASVNQVGSVTSAGSAVGLTIGSALPAASDSNNRYYVVVSDSGTGTGNAPTEPLAPPDMILSNGSTWDLIDVSNAIAGQTATNISFTPYGNIAATNVQLALQELEDEKLPKAGGTVTGELLIGTAGSFAFEGSTDDAYETYLTAVDPTADRTITFPDVSGTVVTTGDTGSITSTMIADGAIVNADINASAAIAFSKLASLTSGHILVGNASNVATNVAVTGDITIGNTGVTAIASGVIVNADINASAAIAGSKIQAATTSNAGAVQLTDSTSSTSTTTAATPNAVKSAYDLANAALPKSGGTMTGAITFAAGQTISGYGAIDTAQTWTKGQRGEITALTSAATITPDFADSNNFSVTLDTSATLANPSNLTAGQSGCIWITQDGTGSRTLAYGSYWDFTGGTAPTLSTAADAVDCLVYAVQSSTKITATLITNLS